MKEGIDCFGVKGTVFIDPGKTPETSVDGTLAMSANRRHRSWQLKMALALGIGGAIAFSGTPTLAQITPDATLGAESSVVTPNVDVRNLPADLIEGGATRGANLFHSFSDLNVGEGWRVYFANPVGIENILSRVTGSNLSNILGTLGVDGGANLFLLNPNGIIFGQNAQLDIAGSFVGSTANSLVFENGIEFSATNPEAPPLLTINITPGLQYGSNHQKVIVNAGNLGVGQDLTLSSGTVTSTGQLTAATGQVTVEGITGDVQVRNVTAQTSVLSARDNLILEESQLRTTGDLTLLAENTVRVRDSVETPFVAHAGGNLTIQGDQAIDIVALNHPQTPFQSGRNLTLISDGNISGDAHFASGGNFSILNLSGGTGSFISLNDPIIRSDQDVTFGDYAGAALKVEAVGSITGGNITITGPDTSGSIPTSDPDFTTLTTSRSLILRAGLASVDSPNVPQLGIGGTNFTSPSAATFPGSITVGRINTGSSTDGIDGGSVILEATGDITATGVNSAWFGPTGSGNGGNVSLTSTAGAINLTGGSIDTFGIIAGSITLTARGNITTGRSISDTGGLNSGAGVRGGDITLTSTTGEIDGTRDRFISNTGSGTAGAIVIHAYGDIRITDLVPSSLTGNSNRISVTSTTGSITTAPNFVGNPGGLYSSSGDGIAGDIELSAMGDITIVGDIHSFSNGQKAGNITMTASNGGITTGRIFAYDPASSNSLIFTGNEINFTNGANSIVASGSQILIQPALPSQNIAIAGAGETGVDTVDLTTTDLTALQNGFRAITIGRTDSSGAITVAGNVIFQDPVTLRSPVGVGSFTATGSITGVDNASVDIQANQNIVTRDITSDIGITLSSFSGAIDTSLGSLDSSGMNGAIALNANNSITISDINTGSSSLTATGSTITQTGGTLTIGGTASFTSTLANTGNVTLNNTTSTLLGNSIIGGDFSLNSAGTVSKVTGGLLRVAGNFTVNGAPGDPTLVDTSNIAPRQVLPNGDVIITQVGTINLPADTVTGNLTVNSLAVIPGQFTEVYNGNSAINLNQPGNFFGGALSLNTPYASINDVTGTPGITQNSAQIVSGTATFNADNGNITLNDSANQFGNLAFTGNDVAINENDGTNLLTSSASGNFSLTSGGAITQTPENRLNIIGDASFTSTLANAGNVTINNANATVLGNSMIGGDFLLDSGGFVSQVPEASLKVAGNTTVNTSGSVTLSNSGNILPRQTLANGDVIITQVGTINLPDNTITGNLTVNSLATGEQFTGIFNSSSAIDLDQVGNFLGGTLSLNTASRPIISATATPGIIQDGSQSVGGSVTFNSAGDITTQDITAAAINLTSTGGSIDTTGGNIITTLSDAGASRDVSLQAAEDIRLGNIDASGETGGNISLISNGTISASGSTIISGTFGAGRGGDINVTAQSVSFTEGASLYATTAGNGTGGDINVTASEFIDLAGVQGISPGGFLSETLGTGAAGNITVNTPRLTVRDGAAVSASTLGSGDGGDVTVNASDLVEVVGVGARANGQIVPSALATASFGTGDAGDLVVNTRNFIVRDGAVASASTFGSGDGGTLTVNASELVQLVNNYGGGLIPSGLSTDSFGSGEGGDLFINAAQLLIQNGAAATSSTFGEGDGGSLTVNASDLVELSGAAANGFASGLYVQSFASGDAGNLDINTDVLKVLDQARASVAAGNATEARIPTGRLILLEQDLIPTNDTATGDAGNLEIEARQIFLDNGKLLASTDSGEGGNITLDVEDTISMRRNSEITATARGIGNGGNITIDTKFLIAQEDSDITANAFDGRGGNIRLTAEGVFLSPDSQITASSERGVDGTVEINTSVDPSRGLTQLPSDLVDAANLVDRSCNPGEGSLRNSSFTVTGRGGLPPSPDEPLNEEGLLEDLGSPVAARDEEQKERPALSAASSSSPLVQIVEAQGWVKNPDGTVILVAEAPTATPQSPRLNPASCESVSNSTETLTASPH